MLKFTIGVYDIDSIGFFGYLMYKQLGAIQKEMSDFLQNLL